MVSESPLEPTEQGLVPSEDGWFVLNARDAPWRSAPGRGALCVFEGAVRFPQVGINLRVLAPGEPMSMYHWEADQEDFLVLDGEALLIVEGEERALRSWDFVHCPPETKHVIVGAGDGNCVLLAVGARDRSSGLGWGGYTVDQTAIRHGAGVKEETTDPTGPTPASTTASPPGTARVGFRAEPGGRRYPSSDGSSNTGKSSGYPAKPVMPPTRSPSSAKTMIP